MLLLRATVRNICFGILKRMVVAFMTYLVSLLDVLQFNATHKSQDYALCQTTTKKTTKQNQPHNYNNNNEYIQQMTRNETETTFYTRFKCSWVFNAVLFLLSKLYIHNNIELRLSIAQTHKQQHQQQLRQTHHHHNIYTYTTV